MQELSEILANKHYEDVGEPEYVKKFVNYLKGNYKKMTIAVRERENERN